MVKNLGGTLCTEQIVCGGRRYRPIGRGEKLHMASQRFRSRSRTRVQSPNHRCRPPARYTLRYAATRANYGRSHVSSRSVEPFPRYRVECFAPMRIWLFFYMTSGAHSKQRSQEHRVLTPFDGSVPLKLRPSNSVCRSTLTSSTKKSRHHVDIGTFWGVLGFRKVKGPVPSFLDNNPIDVGPVPNERSRPVRQSLKISRQSVEPLPRYRDRKFLPKTK
jgi:hypothetical protein